MEPTSHTGQSLTQQGPNASPLDLNAWIVDYIHSHPQAVVDIFTKVASGLLVALLSFILILLWRYFSAAIWRFLGYLGKC